MPENTRSPLCTTGFNASPVALFLRIQKGIRKRAAKPVLMDAKTMGSTSVANRTMRGARPNVSNPKERRSTILSTGTLFSDEFFKLVYRILSIERTRSSSFLICRAASHRRARESTMSTAPRTSPRMCRPIPPADTTIPPAIPITAASA